MTTTAATAPRLAAVTGASGHVGANLVRVLLAQGQQVRALARRTRQAIDDLPVEIAEGDVLDQRSLEHAFAGVDTVFHLAAKLAVGGEAAAPIHEVNVEGTRNVVAACRAVGVRRLVHMSSIQALARPPGKGMVDESCPLVQPGSAGGAYDLAKAEAERIVLAAGSGLDAVILQPTAVLGPFDFRPSPMGAVLAALAHGRMPALLAGAECDFVDVRDVADTAIAAAERGRPGERYLLSGTRLSLRELAHRWASVTGRPAPRWAAPMWLARLAAPFTPSWARLRGQRPLFTSEALRVLRGFPAIDRRKAEHELAYQPRPIDETLRDTWAWMSQRGQA